MKWEDTVQWDALRILGIRRWSSRAGDTEEWRRFLREVRAQKGLERTWMDNKGILSSTNDTI
jgi:hypothetical protein